jgi:hypothetical protein
MGITRMGDDNMINKKIQKLIIKTGIILNLESNQIIKLSTAINLAYVEGWIDSKEAHKKVCENSGIQECICHANKKLKGGDL